MKQIKRFLSVLSRDEALHEEMRRQRTQIEDMRAQLHVEAGKRKALEVELGERDAELERVERQALDGMPGLSSGEIERLAMLAEKCGEVVQAVGKVMRHGWDSSSPFGGRHNRSALEREIGNVLAVAAMMQDEGDLRRGDIGSWQRTKRAGMAAWTHHQRFSETREEQLERTRVIQQRKAAE